MRAASLRRLTVVAAVLFALASGPMATAAFASHGRYFHITWKETATNTVQFTATSAFRRDGYSCLDASGFTTACGGVDGYPAVGDVIPEYIGGSQLNFGDGTYTPQLNYVVTATNPSENWLLGKALDPASPIGDKDTLIDHVYPGVGPWTAEIFSCCTIFSLNNNASGNYRDQTLVDLSVDAESSQSSVPPIVTVGDTGVQTWPVPAIDSGGQTLSWRLADANEACGGCFDPQPPGMTINPASGVVSWDTTGKATGLWFTSVVIESHDAAGAVVSTTQVTYLVQIAPAGANIAPVWTAATPADGTTFTVTAGSPLTISLGATDANSGDGVHIDNLGLPGGATFTSVDGNPASATFAWTPTAAQAGDYLVTFTAQDNGFPQLSAPAVTYVIHVVAPPSGVACKVTGGGFVTTTEKDTFGFTARSDGSVTNASGSVEFQGRDSGGGNVKSISIREVSCNAALTHATIKGTATLDGGGSYAFTVQVDDLGEPGRTDTFAIQLSTGYAAGGTLGAGGNIQIHKS